uniref:Uncharacterized protein n=1 Tax=Oryza sativa subsp. japonica TaxID=39947 RepID=Q6I590_ORYSJ|nr:hypothetical protein [Oryza sativa Japonica Group]
MEWNGSGAAALSICFVVQTPTYMHRRHILQELAKLYYIILPPFHNILRTYGRPSFEWWSKKTGNRIVEGKMSTTRRAKWPTGDNNLDDRGRCHKAIHGAH